MRTVWTPLVSSGSLISKAEYLKHFRERGLKSSQKIRCTQSVRPVMLVSHAGGVAQKKVDLFSTDLNI